MSGWVTMEFADRAKRYDLWGVTRSPEASIRLMMPPLPRRWPDCEWSPRVARPGLLMNLPEGWYYCIHPAVSGEHWAEDWIRIWPTHFMEIPQGPSQ